MIDIINNLNKNIYHNNILNNKPILNDIIFKKDKLK